MGLELTDPYATRAPSILRIEWELRKVGGVWTGVDGSPCNDLRERYMTVRYNSVNRTRPQRGP